MNACVVATSGKDASMKMEAVKVYYCGHEEPSMRFAKLVLVIDSANE